MGAVTYPSKKVSDYVSEYFVPWRIPFDTANNLLRRYNVVWTPTTIFADRKGTECYRVVGYLPPDVFISYLAMGNAETAFGSHNYPEAAELFDTVASDHPESCLAPEAMYYRAVCRAKATGDDAHLDEAVADLERLFPDSDWLLRTRPWINEQG